MPIQNLLAAVATGCARRAGRVVLLGAVLAALAGFASWQRLGVTTDIGVLFDARLPWKQRDAELKRLFPQFADLLVAVVQGDTPEAAEATAAALAERMAADTEHFRTVRRPDASPYLERNGLLFLGTEPLQALLDRTIDAQPFLGQLVADPSARGLFAALSLVGVGVEQAGADVASFEPALRGFHATLAAVLAGQPKPLSWQRLLAGPAADLAGPYRFVLAQPRLDYGALEPGAAAATALRAAAAELEFVRSGAAAVRLTGSVALSDEEFATVAEGAVAGMIGSVLLVALWLYLAVRSVRVIVPVLLTLGLGLVLTTGFAALTVSPLNLISVAFAVLFIGIAVGFSIQFSVRFREARLEQPALAPALGVTARRAGVQILVAAAAAAAGFLAFVPTDFSGVAELGLIAGVGMVIAFVCTLTFLPAALALFQPGAGAAEAGFARAAPLDRLIARRRRPILAAFAALSVLGAALLPRLAFDSDPLRTKDPNTEAMRTLADLIANPLTNPYSIDVLAATPAAAEEVVLRADALPRVADVLSLQSFVPTDQAEKLPLIADAAALLGPTLAERTPAAPVTAADLRLAARSAAAGLEPAVAKLPAGHVLADIAADLRSLAGAPDATLLAADAALTRFLPQQIARLRSALSAGPTGLADVPEEIRRDWVAPDGQRRVQITATPEAQDDNGLRLFVEQVAAALPEAGGSAVGIVASADTIIGAFQRAALGALAAIAVILALVLSRVLDVALVLAALLVSAALTVLAAVLLPLPLNFANIIALPLLLGVGVSFNIYFVMNWRAGATAHLSTPTARAVVFSALTTATAFGSLALSRHPGTASMGNLLLLSLGCTLLTSLVFVPALLAAMRSPGR